VHVNGNIRSSVSLVTLVVFVFLLVFKDVLLSVAVHHTLTLNMVLDNEDDTSV